MNNISNIKKRVRTQSTQNKPNLSREQSSDALRKSKDMWESIVNHHQELSSKLPPLKKIQPLRPNANKSLGNFNILSVPEHTTPMATDEEAERVIDDLNKRQGKFKKEFKISKDCLHKSKEHQANIKKALKQWQLKEPNENSKKVIDHLKEHLAFYNESIALHLVCFLEDSTERAKTARQGVEQIFNQFYKIKLFIAENNLPERAIESFTNLTNEFSNNSLKNKAKQRAFAQQMENIYKSNKFPYGVDLPTTDT